MLKLSPLSRSPTAPLRHFVSGTVLGLLIPVLIMLGLLCVVWSLEQVTQDDPRAPRSQRSQTR